MKARTEPGSLKKTEKNEPEGAILEALGEFTDALEKDEVLHRFDGRATAAGAAAGSYGQVWAAGRVG